MRIFILDKTYSGESLYKLKKRDINYLNNVLRFEKGATFTVKDAMENYYLATLLGDSLSLEKTQKEEALFLDDLSAYKGSFFPINVYQAICKGKKNEQIARCLTETGIKKLTFISTDFSQEKELSSHEKERIDVIIKEAAQQSGAKIPSFAPTLSLKEAVLKAEGKKIVLHQALTNETERITDAIKNCEEISLFIGSEGGFSNEECALFEDSGCSMVLLNTNILRAENAGLYTIGTIQSILNK